MGKVNYTVVFALIFSGVSILTKFLIFVSGKTFDLTIDSYAMYLNLFLILASIFLSIRYFKQKNTQSIFLDDFKNGMKSAALFALMVSVYTFIHYKFIDDVYLTKRIENRMQMANSYDENLLKNNPKQFTKIQFLEKEQAMSEFIFSPFNHASFVLFGYLIIGMIYSIGVTFLGRKSPFILFLKN